ncbi:hypothetical protein EDC04DRAFT_2598454 [Pisolithus marmoratus]|nr:hypothetical protein EDC04DRAFT_2598454 [Pisolithus marmoratus]
MAKTTSKPRKSTGGTAPHVPLSGNNVGVTAIPESAPVNTQVQESMSKDLAISHNFCILCHDGGKPWCCDTCKHVMREHCITIPESFTSNVDVQDMVNTGNITLLVINLHLWGIPSGGPIMMAMQILAPYFPNSGFLFLDVEFDIGNDTKLKKYKQQVSHIISKIKSQSFQNVIIGLTNHLDSKHSNLFIGRSVVSKEARLVTLEDTIIQLGLSSIIAFDAKDLQPVLTSNLVTGLVEHGYSSMGKCGTHSVFPMWNCTSAMDAVTAHGKHGGLDGVQVDGKEPSDYFLCANKACGRPGGQWESIAVIKPKGIKTLNPGNIQFISYGSETERGRYIIQRPEKQFWKEDKVAVVTMATYDSWGWI